LQINLKKVSKPDIITLLKDAFVNWSGEKPSSFLPLPVSGSGRQYFRFRFDRRTVIGVWSENQAENAAFVHFTEHFRSLGLNVPELYYKDLKNNLYLIEDLGDETLYSFIMKNQEDKPISNQVIPHYQSALKHLIRFQLDGKEDLDFSLCIPRPVFDKQSILWDLQYFKYYVLKLFNIPFDEQKLEDDFSLLTDVLLSVEYDYFMYRDFQSRNILIHDGDLYFVDYQGGRKGPLQYDLASLLFEARINFLPEIREELIDFYISELSQRVKVDTGKFREYLYLFVFLRVLQVLAAYGLRGYVQNKSIFLRSYPFAVDNLQWLLDNKRIKLDTTELLLIAEKILGITEIREKHDDTGPLNVYINSFSYKYGVPKDYSGHGGGFVFDCRVLPNPGRYPEYKDMTGLDDPVIKFLEEHHEVDDFLQQVRKIVDISLQEYLQKDKNRLTISFGCTGGQHRSVYCAEKIADYISEKYNLKPILIHGFYKNLGK
jgi:aminoglycoside/choline kinase family phosphotransferase